MAHLLYTTDKRHAGWFCDRCGDKSPRGSRRCRHCGHPSLHEVLYFPTHDAAARFAAHSPRQEA